MAKKRANSEGTIRKRSDGRWEARLSLEDGTRKSFYGATRQEVARLLTQATRDRDKGLPVVGERQTVGDYLASWLTRVKPTIRASTWRRYSEYVNLHIVPTLGKVVLSRLTPQQVQALYAAKLEQGLSPSSVVHLHAVLHHALDDAFRLSLVQRNICDMVDPPRVTRREMITLAPEQIGAFLNAAKGERLEALFILALTTGMREGELFALRWRDVDLGQRYLQVRASLQRTPDGLVIAEPKTRSSRRRVSLSSVAVEALRQHRARQAGERELVGAAWEDNDLVFCNAIGRPLDAVNFLRRDFHPVLKKAGLPLMRFHDMRHSAATLLLGKDIHPKVVSEMLGHANINITLDLYSHVLPDMQRDATSAMDWLLNQDE